GRGGAAGPNALRLPLADVGVAGDLDLVVPTGLGAFVGSGTRRFFHGGLSPQELLIPVLDVRVPLREPSQKRKVSVEIAGKRITTGAFSARIGFESDLFTPELPVRLVARRQPGEEVARLVAGEGFEANTAVVVLRGAQPQIVTFRVTLSLVRGDRV